MSVLWRGWLAAWLTAESLQIEFGRLPPPHTLSTISRIYVYGKPAAGGGADAWVPSFGWGLWDVAYPLHARVVTDGVHVKVAREDLTKYVRAGDQKPPGVVWLAMMRSEDFWREFMPFQEVSHFCCRAVDTAEHRCEAERQFFLPESLRPKVMVAPVAMSAYKEMRTDAVFPLDETGVYYILLVNCMDKEAAAATADDSAASLWDAGGAPLPHEIHGRLVAESTHGFLSGIDVPKTHLYFWISVVTAWLALWWMIIITQAVEDDNEDVLFGSGERRLVRLPPPNAGEYYREQGSPPEQELQAFGSSGVSTGRVSFVHNYMSLILLLQLMESVFHYIYYSWENNSSTGASVVVELVAVAASTLKVVTGITLMLNLSLGLYSLYDRMPQYLKVRLWFLSAWLVALIGVKLCVCEFHSVFHLSATSVSLCFLPLVAVMAGVCVWTWTALNKTLAEVRRLGAALFSKYVMLAKLRRVVVVAAVLYVVSGLSQIYMIVSDSENVWKYEYLFTDLVPTGVFLLLTLSMAIIIRPALHELARERDTVQVVDEDDDDAAPRRRAAEAPAPKYMTFRV